MPSTRPWAVLFDLDGTLIDSVGFILESLRHAFRDRVPAPTEAEWIAGLGTPLATQLRPWAVDDVELAELIAAYRAHQRQHLERLTVPFDEVTETMRALKHAGHPMALVTSKGDEIARRSARHAGLEPFLETVVGCDSCRLHKPEPEPVHVALARLGYGAHEAVFVGDSPHDMLSGNAAGVVTVAALWGPFTRDDLAPSAPAHYIERITELVPLLSRLEAAARG